MMFAINDKENVIKRMFRLETMKDGLPQLFTSFQLAFQLTLDFIENVF